MSGVVSHLCRCRPLWPPLAGCGETDHGPDLPGSEPRSNGLFPPALLMNVGLKHSICSGAITPKHTCGKQRAISLTAASGLKLCFSELPHVSLLKPLIGFGTSTGLLTTLMVLVSHAG